MTWIVPISLVLAAPTYEEVVWTGQVVSLAAALGEFGLAHDSGPIVDQVVLRTDDRRIVPLISDPASRALFADDRLRARPIEIQGRIHEGLPYLLVTSFRVQEDGTWRTPEYYCDICTISVRDPQVCPCCQGSMELRMRPETP